MNNENSPIIKWVNKLTLIELSRFSFAICILWVVFPILIFVLSTFGIDDYNTCGVWVTVLYVTGGIGLLLGLLYFFKTWSVFKYETEERNVIFDTIILMIVFAFWCVLSTFFAQEKRIAIYGYDTFRDCLFTYLFYGGCVLNGIVLSNYKELVVKLSRSLIFVSFVLSFLELTKIGNDKFYGYRSVFYEENYFGIYLALAAFLSVIFLLQCTSSFQKIISAALSLFFFYMLFLNATFSAIASLAVVLVLALMLGFAEKTINKRKTAVTIVAIMIVMAILVALLFYFHDSSSFKDLVFRESTEKSIAVNHNGADYDFWEIPITRIQNNAIVGIGLQNTLSSYGNTYLQLALYIGLPGLFLYISMLIISFKNVISNTKFLNQMVNKAALIVVMYLIFAGFNNSIFYIAPYFYIAFGVMLGSSVRIVSAEESL